jgi:hypothetical protein
MPHKKRPRKNAEKGLVLKTVIPMITNKCVDVTVDDHKKQGNRMNVM